MAKRGRTPGTDAAAWLPPELRGDVEAPATPNRDVASDQAGETGEWLAVPQPDQERPRSLHETPNGSPGASTEVDATDLEPSEFEPTDDELASQLRRAKEKLSAQDEVIEELKERVESLEGELESTNRTLNEKLAEAAKAERKKPAERTRKPRPKPKATAKPTAMPKAPRKRRKDAGLDLNSATFEQLRELGLSITQSARLIAYRDTRGRFESLDDVGAVPGFSRDTLRELSSKTRI